MRRYGLIVPFPLFVGDVMIRGISTNNEPSKRSTTDIMHNSKSITKKNPNMIRIKDQDRINKRITVEKLNMNEDIEEESEDNVRMSIYNIESPTKIPNNNPNLLGVPTGSRPKSSQQQANGKTGKSSMGRVILIS